MLERVTTLRGNRVTTPHQDRVTAPRPLPTVSRSQNALPRRLPSTRPARSSVDLRRAVSRWLGDGKAQGWSARTLQNREETMERFCWWPEHEAALATTLDALSPRGHP